MVALTASCFVRSSNPHCLSCSHYIALVLWLWGVHVSFLISEFPSIFQCFLPRFLSVSFFLFLQKVSFLFFSVFPSYFVYKKFPFYFFIKSFLAIFLYKVSFLFFFTKSLLPIFLQKVFFLFFYKKFPCYFYLCFLHRFLRVSFVFLFFCKKFPSYFFTKGFLLIFLQKVSFLFF